MTIGPEVPEGRSVGPQGEEAQGRPTEKAHIDIQGTLHTIHQIASSKRVEEQMHPELASTIQFLVNNLASIPQKQVESLTQDITLIKKGLEGSSGDAKEVVKEINNLLKIVQEGAKRAREEEVLEKLEALQVQEEFHSNIPGLPEDTVGEIVSHLPKEEVFKLQAVSRGFSRQKDVEQARKEFADTIAKNAIQEILTQKKPLTHLKNVLSDATRNAVRSLNLSKITLTADDLGTFAELFPNVTGLDLSGTQITNDHLQQLHNFTSLQNLNLQDCNLKDESLQNLSQLDQLQKVDLSMNPDLTGSSFDQLPLSLLELDARTYGITDASVALLSRLNQLQKVNLSENRALTGSTFDQLPPSLLELYAHFCAITDASVLLLSRLDRLQKVFLSENPALTGSTFDQLPPSLLELYARYCAITDDSVVLLSGLNQLQGVYLSHNRTLTGSTFDRLPLSLLELNASRCAITDENVAKLYRLDRLQKVHLSGNRALTDDARNRLKSALPNLLIEWVVRP